MPDWTLPPPRVVLRNDRSGVENTDNGLFKCYKLHYREVVEEELWVDEDSHSGRGSFLHAFRLRSKNTTPIPNEVYQRSFYLVDTFEDGVIDYNFRVLDDTTKRTRIDSVTELQLPGGYPKTTVVLYIDAYDRHDPNTYDKVLAKIEVHRHPIPPPLNFPSVFLPHLDTNLLSMPANVDFVQREVAKALLFADRIHANDTYSTFATSETTTVTSSPVPHGSKQISIDDAEVMHFSPGVYIQVADPSIASLPVGATVVSHGASNSGATILNLSHAVHTVGEATGIVPVSTTRSIQTFDAVSSGEPKYEYFMEDNTDVPIKDINGNPVTSIGGSYLTALLGIDRAAMTYWPVGRYRRLFRQDDPLVPLTLRYGLTSHHHLSVTIQPTMYWDERPPGLVHDVDDLPLNSLLISEDYVTSEMPTLNTTQKIVDSILGNHRVYIRDEHGNVERKLHEALVEAQTGEPNLPSVLSWPFFDIAEGVNDVLEYTIHLPQFVDGVQVPLEKHTATVSPGRKHADAIVSELEAQKANAYLHFACDVVRGKFRVYTTATCDLRLDTEKSTLNSHILRFAANNGTDMHIPSIDSVGTEGASYRPVNVELVDPDSGLTMGLNVKYATSSHSQPYAVLKKEPEEEGFRLRLGQAYAPRTYLDETLLWDHYVKVSREHYQKSESLQHNWQRQKEFSDLVVVEAEGDGRLDLHDEGRLDYWLEIMYVDVNERRSIRRFLRFPLEVGPLFTLSPVFIAPNEPVPDLVYERGELFSQEEWESQYSISSTDPVLGSNGSKAGKYYRRVNVVAASSIPGASFLTRVWLQPIVVFVPPEISLGEYQRVYRGLKKGDVFESPTLSAMDVFGRNAGSSGVSQRPMRLTDSGAVHYTFEMQTEGRTFEATKQILVYFDSDPDPLDSVSIFFFSFALLVFIVAIYCYWKKNKQ